MPDGESELFILKVDKGKINDIAKGETDVGTLVKECFETRYNYSVATIHESCVLLNDSYEEKVECKCTQLSSTCFFFQYDC